MRYLDDRLGLLSDDDRVYVIDDFGFLRPVPFTLSFFFDEI